MLSVHRVNHTADGLVLKGSTSLHCRIQFSLRLLPLDRIRYILIHKIIVIFDRFRYVVEHGGDLFGVSLAVLRQFKGFGTGQGRVFKVDVARRPRPRAIRVGNFRVEPCIQLRAPLLGGGSLRFGLVVLIGQEAQGEPKAVFSTFTIQRNVPFAICKGMAFPAGIIAASDPVPLDARAEGQGSSLIFTRTYPSTDVDQSISAHSQPI